jgi:hypothetical protein
LVQHEHLRGASYARLKGSFTAVGCTFQECDFREMRPRHLTFAGGVERTRYIDCSFDGCKLARLVTGQARFERCSFADVDIKGFFGHATEFVDCVFSGVLRASVFYGHVPAPGNTTQAKNEFRANDFSKIKFADVGFLRGIDLSAQQLPSGDNYLYLENPVDQLLTLRQQYLAMPPSELRRDVFRFLEVCQKDLQEGQAQLFLCKDSEVNRISAASVDAIWAELRKRG